MNFKLFKVNLSDIEVVTKGKFPTSQTRKGKFELIYNFSLDVKLMMMMMWMWK